MSSLNWNVMPGRNFGCSTSGDHVTCHPASAEAFARRCGGPLEMIRIMNGDDRRRAPGHMEIVTGDRARTKLLAALAWIEAELR